jgi:hypothetical protein
MVMFAEEHAEEERREVSRKVKTWKQLLSSCSELEFSTFTIRRETRERERERERE